MAKLAVKKYFRFIILVFTAFMTVATIYGLFGGDTNPASRGGTSEAMFCFALPILIAIDICLIVLWLILKRWYWALMPFIAVLCCLGYIGTFFRLGSGAPDTIDKLGLKICTYNVGGFGKEASNYISQDILSELKNQHADIVCFQEYREHSGDINNTERYKEEFPYAAMGNKDMIIFSRFPITGSKNIQFEETNNSSMYADINVNGKMLRVFNVHMQTTGVNRTLYKAGKASAQGQKVESSKVLKAIYGNYMLDLMIRAGQANQVATEVRQSEYPVVLCGDFNDVPYSYVYNTLKGDLKDGFCDKGGGWMWTFRGKKAFRIDYIFYDKSIPGVSYYKKELTYSDHIPVFSKIDF